MKLGLIATTMLLVSCTMIGQTIPTAPAAPSDPGFPAIPSNCELRHGAHLYTDGGFPYHSPIKSSDDTTANATTDTANIQGALTDAAPGGSNHSGCVELAPSSGGYSVLLLNPITIPAGVNLIVDAGVTLVGTRNVAAYQVTGGKPCGGVGGGSGCKPLITFGANSSSQHSGVYGYGVIDGRGYAPMDLSEVSSSYTPTTVPSGYASPTWWGQTLYKSSAQTQSLPALIDVASDNVTLYKITLRNSPFYHVEVNGQRFLSWGVKIATPWNVGNTDGIDVFDANANVINSVISTGDDDVAVQAYWVAGDPVVPVDNVLIRGTTTYGRNGVSMGASSQAGIYNIYVTDINETGDVVSWTSSRVNGVSFPVSSFFDSQGNQTVSNIPASEAMEYAFDTIRGLNLKIVNARENAVASGAATYPSGLPVTPSSSFAGGWIENVLYQNACLQDIHYPLTSELYLSATGTEPIYDPTVGPIFYNNVHILKPIEMPNGTASWFIPRFYSFFNDASGNNQTDSLYFQNVVADDISSGVSSLNAIYSHGDVITTSNNVYPASLPGASTPVGFNGLTAPNSASDTYHAPTTSNDELALNLNDTSYSSMTSGISSSGYNCSSTPSVPYSPSGFPFLAGEIFLSEGSGYPTGTSNDIVSGSISQSATVNFNAVLAPAMSQSSLYEGNTSKGTFAVGAPTLSGTVIFTATPVGGGIPITLGSATFSSSTPVNQTLLTVYGSESLAHLGLVAGTQYKITGNYTDSNYPSYTFGGSIITVTT